MPASGKKPDVLRIPDQVEASIQGPAGLPKVLALRFLRKGEALHPGVLYGLSPSIARQTGELLLKAADELTRQALQGMLQKPGEPKN